MQDSTISSPEWDRVTELFTATFEAPPEERRRRLASYPADDPLRQRVEELLAAHDADGGVLDEPAALSLESLDSELLDTLPSLVGQTLGPYRVIRELGRGGMGTVYEGVREDAQFEQRVAIKTLRLGLDSPSVVQRFHQERRILAGLQHPHIAALYDGNVTATGLPYFVLEFVDGQSIDAFCRERKLPLRARLDLFLQVLSAVEYAHRQLIVHRDLKPGNILVTNDGIVKLVDFGIAKLLEDGSPEMTADARAPLTLDYASPEQVRGDPITTATDVYSLGGVLYQLLTARKPLDLDSVSLDRAVVAVCHELPPPPSAAASLEGAEAMGLGSRDRLRKELAGDLDAIVMGALRKEPNRRYASAQAFGEDIRRYLKGLPVLVAPDRLSYRARKFVRRHRGLVAGTTFAVLALLGGTGLALWEARAAQHEAVKANRIAEFLQGILGARLTGSINSTMRLSQSDLTLERLLDTAAARLPRELVDEPEVRARLHRVIGLGYAQATNLKAARVHFDSALAIHQRLLGPDHLETARDLSLLSEIVMQIYPDSAEPLARRAVSLFRKNRDADSLGEVYNPLSVLARAQSYGGKLAAAETTYAALEGALRARPKPDLPAIAQVLSSWGLNLHNQGKLDSAEVVMRHGIAVFDSAAKGPSFEEAGYLMTLASHLLSKGKPAQALPVAERAREMARVTVQPIHTMQVQIGMLLAGALGEVGDSARSDSVAAAALAIFPKLPPGSEIYQFLGVWTHARTLRRAGRLARAEAAARWQYDLANRTARGFPHYMADAEYLLGGVLSDRGKYQEAEPHLLEAYRIANEKFGASHSRTIRGAKELAVLYLRWGKGDRGARYLALLSPAVADSIRRTAHR